MIVYPIFLSVLLFVSRLLKKLQVASDAANTIKQCTTTIYKNSDQFAKKIHSFSKACTLWVC